LCEEKINIQHFTLNLTDMALTYCPSCGTKVAGNANWCTNCGANLASQSTPAPTPGPTPIQPQAHTQAPQPTVNQDQPVCPKSYLAESILVTLFCCMPFGIVAIINANDVSSAFMSGNYNLAVEKSNNAKKWIKWALICWVIYIICIAIFYFVYFGALFAIIGEF
jgi:hypothetical protein